MSQYLIAYNSMLTEVTHTFDSSYSYWIVRNTKEEADEYVERLKNKSNCKIIKIFRLDDQTQLTQVVESQHDERKIQV